MREALIGTGILSISHVLLVLWRYELLPFSVIWAIPLICLGIFILLISELLWHQVLSVFELIDSSHRYALSFVLLIAVLANLTLIGPGYFHADGLTHAFKVWYLRKAWLNGNFYPLWCPYWHSGYPFLAFYGPLFYVFAAFLSLFSDWMFGSKLAVYIACVLSPLAMYGLIYVITQDKLGGVIGGLAYNLTYFKIGLLTKYGNITSSPVLFFLPLLFLFLELAYKKEKHLYAVYAGFCWAGVFLSHAGAGYMVSLLVFFYLIISCAIRFNLKNIYFMGRLGLISASVTLGLSSFFIIPYFIEGIAANTRVFDPHWLGYPLSLTLILTRDFIHIYKPFGPVYIGNSILILAFLAIFLRRNRASIIYTASLLFSLFFVIGSELPFYTKIPLITSLEFPYRFLLLVSFVASVLSGVTVSFIKNINKPHSKYLKKLSSNPRLQKRVIVLLMIIIIIDLWPGTLVSKNRPPEWFVDDNWYNAYTWFDENPGYYKVYNIISGPPAAVFPAVVGNKFVPGGYFRQAENRDYGEFTNIFGRELKSLEDSPRKGFLTPLKLLGAKYMLLDTSKDYARYLIESPELEMVQKFGRVSILEYSGYTSPVIISQTAAFLGSDREIKTFYAHVTNPDYDPSEMIFLKEKQYYTDIAVPLNSLGDSVDKNSFTSYVLDLEVKENTIFAKLYTSAPSFVFFSFNFFPGWKALVDGNESKILIAEPFFMCLYIDTNGTHEITLEYHLSTPKTIGLFITVFTLLISLFVILWPSRKTIKEIVR